ncbi:DUF2254 domain-containing protein [Pontibacter sp. HJ8]
MSKRTTSSYKFYATITSSIAFWPALIAVAFFMLALFMLYFESIPLSASIEKKLPFSMVREEENARMILSTLAAGTISLTVFSFSMVMIVLSQASSSFSPRVVPGLITVKAHQLVLGFYIGTIIYALILLLNIKTPKEDVLTPTLAILLSLFFGIVCLALFVYFIHSISRSIQVDNILNRVFQKAYNILEREEKARGSSNATEQQRIEPADYVLPISSNGYLKLVDMQELSDLALEHDLQLELQVEVGAFLVEGRPLMRLTRDLAQEPELAQQLQDCFVFSMDEVVMEDFEQGVKQLSEIAVKALSPGINDPATAIKAIDFLTLLFIRKMKSKEQNCFVDDQNCVRVVEQTVSLDELLHRYLTPIRTYGSQDLQVNVRLLRCLESLILADCSTRHHVGALSHHAMAVVYSAQESLKNPVDNARLNEMIHHLNTTLPDVLNLNFLEV